MKFPTLAVFGDQPLKVKSCDLIVKFLHPMIQSSSQLRIGHQHQ